MKNLTAHVLILILLTGAGLPFFSCKDASVRLKGNDIPPMLDRLSEWQMANSDFAAEGNLHDYGIDSWVNAVFYLGLSRWAARSDSPERYLEWLKELGAKTGWEISDNFANNSRYGIYHADELCMGQFYLSMYDVYGDPEMIRSTSARIDSIIANPGNPDHDYRNKQSWSWCDALFMAPPVYAGMGRLTGQDSYIRYMDREFRRTVASLYDRDEKLFYRDGSYIGKTEANGEKIFWGRGNGWVIAGLANVLRALPEGHQAIPYYENLMTEMAARLVSLQDEGGYWHASLLDPESYPSPEASATALIAYGLAYGINRGILPRDGFQEPVVRAWNWLVTAVDEDGRAGWVQPVGSDPKKVNADMTAPYGAGAILLAGTEIYEFFINGN